MNKLVTIAFFLITAFIIPSEGQAMSQGWFQTWDRPEYLEWAAEIPEGYLLHIIRKEKDNYLVVQAKLIMVEKGLPGFEVVQQNNVPSMREAMMQIQTWEENCLLFSHQ